MRSVITAILLAFGLLACSSAPPAPVDRFYRLQATPVVSGALAASLQVMPFRADSLYAERPMVFSMASDPRQLQQYHYHLWLYAPAQMVHDHLNASLGLTAATGKVAEMTLEGRVLHLDRVISGKAGKAVVVLELRLRRGDKMLVSKTFSAEQEAVGEGVSAHVVAVEQALAKIYGEFLKDAGAR